MNRALLFAILFITIFTYCYAQSLSIGILNTTVCSASQFFDSTLLNCNSCPNNEGSIGNQTNCACTIGTAASSLNVIGFKSNCTTCPTVK